MVTYCVKKMMTTCSPMIGQFFDTMIVASSLRIERSGFEPWPGSLCCVLVSWARQEYKWVPANCSKASLVNIINHKVVTVVTRLSQDNIRYFLCISIKSLTKNYIKRQLTN